MLDIIDRLPELKLYYEKYLHNKVFSDEYMAIPQGETCLLWYTYKDDKNICVVIYLNKTNKIINSKIHTSCFSSDLCMGKGTILYGVLFKTTHNNYSINNFAVINIHYFEGVDVFQNNYKNKVVIFKNLFNKIKQICFTKNDIVIGLPLISSDYNYLTREIPKLPYRVNYIKPINLKLYNLNLNFPIHNNNFNNNNNNNNNNNSYNNGKHNNTHKNYNFNNKNTNKFQLNKNNNKFQLNKNNKCIFMISADVEPDIYILKCNDNKDFKSTAYIPDYKTSIMMNSIFRNIKENNNLDLLEESDDDDEFEDIRHDKFVDTKKQVKMECEFSNKFKQWIPLNIIRDDVVKDIKISSFYDINKIELM
jgi:hypothetical protein